MMLGSAGVRSVAYGSPINWAAPLNSGLRAWWVVLPRTMSGQQWRDLTGRAPAIFNNVGSTSPTSGWGATGRRGGWGELRFDGTDDYVNAGSLPHLANVLGQNPGTLSLWMKPNTMADCIVAGKNDSNSVNAGWWLENIVSTPNAGVAGLRFAVEKSTTNMRAGVASPPNAVWTHIVVVGDGTFTGANQKLYYNGVLQTLTTTIDGVGTNGSDAAELMTLARNRPTSSALVSFAPYKGAMDDVRLYNGMLTEPEIKALYQASLQGYPQELNWQTWPPAWAVTSAVPAVQKAPPPARRPWRVFRRAA